MVKGAVKDLLLSCSVLGCCCGMGLIPGPRTSTCQGCGKKKKKKKRKEKENEKPMKGALPE